MTGPEVAISSTFKLGSFDSSSMKCWVEFGVSSSCNWCPGAAADGDPPLFHSLFFTWQSLPACPKLPQARPPLTRWPQRWAPCSHWRKPHKGAYHHEAGTQSLMWQPGSLLQVPSHEEVPKAPAQPMHGNRWLQEPTKLFPRVLVVSVAKRCAHCPRSSTSSPVTASIRDWSGAPPADFSALA